MKNDKREMNYDLLELNLNTPNKNGYVLEQYLKLKTIYDNDGNASYDIDDDEKFGNILYSLCYSNNLKVKVIEISDNSYSQGIWTLEDEDIIKFVKDLKYFITFDNITGFKIQTFIEVNHNRKINKKHIETKVDIIDEELDKTEFTFTVMKDEESGNNRLKFIIENKEKGNKIITNKLTKKQTKKYNKELSYTRTEKSEDWDFDKENAMREFVSNEIFEGIIKGLIKRYVYFDERYNKHAQNTVRLCLERIDSNKSLSNNIIDIHDMFKDRIENNYISFIIKKYNNIIK